ncbi:asparagine synthase-related protein [Streptomyces sp. MMBL 11-3]|uniref:asparagine synthase-related protein n=1 Tax=Streptomyces sp. MMBL 11-3 TaxID=3382639 RepID=UPI0039B4D790
MASGPSRSWFVVVPDRELPPGPLTRLMSRAGRVVRYPSGRPWLLGDWAPERMVVASAGGRLLAVAGTSSVTAPDLQARLKGVSAVADVEGALRGVHGSFHVVASLEGRGYVRGSASGACRVHRAVVDGVTVCADRARTLAWLTGAEPDTAQLAARLASCLPHPLAGAAMWSGVETVPPGHALHLGPGGGCRTVAWWRAPEAGLPLAEAALALREALSDAVALRVRPGQVLAADLSGGMDSTSLCFLAAEAGASLVTATLHWEAPGNEDRDYARYAADRLPGAESLVFPSAGLPPCFAGLERRRDPQEEPSPALRDREIQQHLTRALRARGATLRLTGHGGDHAVVPPASYIHALLRRSPARALRHTAGFRAQRRWPLGATARVLLRDGSYPHWLTTASGGLREAAVPLPACETWGPRPALPPWASTRAADQFAALLRSAAGRTVPLAADFSRHAWIHQMREAGRIAGLIDDDTTAGGLPADSPFCDDTVLDACLSVRSDQAGHPWSYKPLLAAAMEGLVPGHLLRRTTKDHCDVEWYRGIREHRRQLAEWAGASHLVAAGVAEEDGLRRALLSPGLQTGGGAELENTLGVEAWLRDVAAHPVPAYLNRTPRPPHQEPLIDSAAP